jgi:putative ABC transport system permease protein
MNAIALKMLFGDRLKYLGLIVGITFAAMLICQQASILVGLSKQTGSFIRDTSHADLWIMDPQVRFSQDSQPLRDTVVQQTRSVTGVEWAVPLFQSFTRGQLADGTRITMILIGLDDATLMGRPPLMVQGSPADLRRDRGVLIDAATAATKLAMQRGGGRELRVGDHLSINDNDAVVVGSYRASASFFWEPVIYTTYSRALQWAPRERNLLSFVLVKVKPGADLEQVRQAIERKTGLKARTNEEFIQLTADYILNATGILINFGMAVALGFVIGLIVAGQTLYNFTLDNLRHYGSLKAMGVSNVTLARMVLLQSLTVAAFGYSIGVGLASLMGLIVSRAGLAFAMPWQIPALTAVAILMICVIASLLSLIPVFRLEPAVVFKG